MARRAGSIPIESAARCSGIRVVIDWSMSQLVRLTGAVHEALIGIPAVGIQHGEPGERGEFHRMETLS